MDLVNEMKKKDVIFWFTLGYIIVCLVIFVIVDPIKAASLSSAVAVLTGLLASLVAAVGFNLNTDKKLKQTDIQNNIPTIPEQLKGK